MHRYRGIVIAAAFAVLSLALLGASCDKRSVAGPTGKGASGGGADAGKGGAADIPKSKVPGIDVADLDDSQKARLDKLLDTLQSPCGKAHSLRTSMKSDKTCKRAPFAGRYLVLLLKAELPDEDISSWYTERYLSEKTVAPDVSKSPYHGVPNAKVVIVEYFDYGCSHCAEAAPELARVANEFPSDVVIYYKNFPLDPKGASVLPAIASRAAQKQHMFDEMHHKLWEHFGEFTREDLLSYAKEIGLDLEQFKADLDGADMRKLVFDDRNEGDTFDFRGTPAIYVNGRYYSDPPAYLFLRDWVEEELAVNP